ncbi:MAG: DNA-formamidopyrimidine glycosylase family protein [bacterium]
MPELPEVTTTVLGLKQEAVGFSITDCWSDLPTPHPKRKDFLDTIKYEPFFKQFKRLIVGQKIIGAHRRAKNILIDLSNGYTILIHLKMTGHLMVGLYDYDKKNNSWSVHLNEKNDSLRDSYNRFIHCVFTLEQKGKTKHLVFCDARKFGKITIEKTTDIETSKHLKDSGPEPINSQTHPDITQDISFADFENTLDKAKGNTRPIKTFLMDTRTIAGIGNIYSDELLFRAGVHPKSNWNNIPKEVRKNIYKAMLVVLKKGIDFGGDSTSDYRNIHGKPGQFHENHLAYKMNGTKCGMKNCNGTILREVINGRSAHFCDTHQVRYN